MNPKIAHPKFCDLWLTKGQWCPPDSNQRWSLHSHLSKTHFPNCLWDPSMLGKWYAGRECLRAILVLLRSRQGLSFHHTNFYHSTLLRMAQKLLIIWNGKAHQLKKNNYELFLKDGGISSLRENSNNIDSSPEQDFSLNYTILGHKP